MAGAPQLNRSTALPRRRQGETIRFVVNDAKGHLGTGALPDGRLVEVRLWMDKQGSTVAGVADALSTAISTGLQAGAPLSTYVTELRATNYPPAGATDDPDIPGATSVMDYVVRRLEIDYPNERARGQSTWTDERG
jgi:ribonucleoside-diphosphate reductase alpha chain